MKPRGRSAGRVESPGAGLLSIGALSRATNIPIQTLRTWELRYGAPVPVRKPSGHRLYPADAVEGLLKVAELLDRGHRPGQILGLPVAELESLLALSANSNPPVPAAQGGAQVNGVASEPSIGGMLDTLAHFDREALLGMLRANWARLGPLPFLEGCAGVFLVEVGKAWREGRLEISHEHFATACLADFLREVREPFDRRARGPRIVAATPPGDLHEGGLLMASVLMSMRGRRVIYLGVNVPVKQITLAARARDVTVVAVSVSAGKAAPRAGEVMAELRAALPRRVALWMGGAGAPKPRQGVERFLTLEALDERLSTRA